MTPLPHFTMLGAGQTVLMLHGIGGGHMAFAPQLETLASNGYRAVSWDMPGYGRSAPVEPYTFKALAQSCIQLIEALGRRRAEAGGPGGTPAAAQPVRPVVLLGHSMGGMVAQEVIARRPDLVSRLILCGTSSAFGKPDGDWQREFIRERTAPLDAGQSMAELAATLVPRMVGPAALPEGVRLAEQIMGTVHPSTYRQALQALLSFDRRAALASIRVPTLLIAGELDRNAPASVMKRMGEAIEDSAYRELPGIGHLQNLEAPDDFDGAVLDFLSRTAPRH